MLIWGMLLSRIRAVNFRQYRELDVAFRDGITGIVGRNGSGKSTILEAVLWCLFGNRAARTSKEGIKRQAAPEGELCRVRLDFILGGATYHLSRSLVGRTNRSEAKLTQEGRIDAVTTREVDDYVIRLIGLNLKGFLSSFFARQRELNALSDARPADRKDHLARMLGVGRLDSAVLLLKEDIKGIRQRIDILGSLQIDPDAVTGELVKKKTDLAVLEKEKETSRSKLDRCHEEADRRAATVAKLREQESEFNRLEQARSILATQVEVQQKETARLTREIEELQKVAEKLEPLERRSQGVAALEEAVSGLNRAKILVDEKHRLERDLTALTANLAREQDRKSTLEKEAARLTDLLADKDIVVERIAEGEVRLEQLRQEYQRISEEVRVIRENLKVLDDQKREIQELGPQASCKLCLRPFAGELEDIERHFDEEIHSLRHRVDPMEKRLKEVDRAGRALKEQLQTARATRERYNKEEQRLATVRASLEAALASLADLSGRTADIDSRLKDIGEVRFEPNRLAEVEKELVEKKAAREEYLRLTERISRRPELEKELNRTEGEIKRTETELESNQKQQAALAFDREAYQQALDQLDKVRDQAAEIRVEIERADGKIRLLVSEADALTRRLEEFEKSKKEIRRLREELEYLEKLSILFSEFRVYLIGRIRPSLSKRTSQMFYEMTGGRYQEIELDEDYSLQIFDRGERFPITRFSGGEIDLANLCFRLAISVEMAATAGIEQSFIILDEIFGSQDSERQRMIFEGLGRLKNRFRQIVIISHIDDVKEMAENLISVEVDGAGISHAVTIEG